MAWAIKITGIVVDGTSEKGLAGLSVEAWGKGLQRGKPIISGVTNRKGRFSLKLKRAELLKLFGSGNPKLYFRVLADTEVLADTAGSVEWTMGFDGRLKIVVDGDADEGDGDDKSTEEDNTPNLIGGIVLYADGRPFSGSLVRAYHTDHGGILRLGEDHTDAEGRYTIYYARLPDASSVNLSVAVLGTDGKPRVESRVKRKAKRLEIVDLTVPAVDATTFHVSGRIVSRSSAAMGGLQIRIVDKVVGEDVKLAESVTGEDGTYQVSFTDAALHERQKKQPDLQARAYSGSTFLAASQVRYNASPRETLDILLEGEIPAVALRSEHETLAGALLSHFDGQLRELKETDDRPDITYLANKTGWDARAVALAALADQFGLRSAGPGRGDGIEPAFFYALFRAGLPANEAALYLTQARIVERVWNQAVAQGVIPDSLKAGIPSAVKRFQELSVQHALGNSATVGVSSLSELLSVSLGDNVARQEQFADLYTRYRNDSPKFWEAVTGAFGESAAKRLKVDGQLAYLTLNNGPLIEKLHEAAGRSDLEDPQWLAEQGFHRADKWREALGGVPIPRDIPGSSDDEKRNRYVELLAAQVRLSYPTAALASMVKGGETPVSDQALKEDVHTFLSKHQGKFEIGMQPVEQYVKLNAVDIQPEVVAEVTRIQRVYQITPNDEAMNLLLKRGLDSSWAIVQHDRDRFIRSFKGVPGGEANARQIYARAQNVHNTVLNLAVSYLTASEAPGIGVHSPPRFVDPRPHPYASDVIAYATLEKLLGEMDYCECEHCRSVFGPAAYLVDLLMFCDQREDQGQSPLQVLLSRRPDIEHLPLTCENTNTLLPYIDLVNETLEYYVTNNSSLVGYEGHSTDGDATPEELQASPVFVRDAAYTTLAQAIFPPPLPFHQPLENLRRYFEKFDAPLPRVMEALREGEDLERADPQADPPLLVEYGWRDIWMEELGLSRTEYKVLTDSTLTLQKLYGYPPGTRITLVRDQLSNAKAFTRRIGISYEDLFDILKTRFVNPHSTLIPKLERLGVHFSTLEALKNGLMTDEQFDDALATHLDSSRYDGDIKSWVKTQENYDRIMGLLTLVDPESPDEQGSFDTVMLRYADPVKIDERIRDFEFVRLLRFIRLWKKLGWTVEQTDKAITALYPDSHDPDRDDDAENLTRLDKGFLELLPCLGVVSRVMKDLKLDPDRHLLQLLACFAPIDTHGAMSHFRQMFLSPGLMQLTDAFADDGYGNYLDGSADLKDQAEILRAAFQLTEDEFSRILNALDYDDDEDLNLDTITAVFQRGWLARILRLSVSEFLLLTRYTDLDPFTAPDLTAPPILRLVDLTHRLSAVSLKPAQALYLIWNQDISGRSAPEEDEIHGFIRMLRVALAAIEAEYAFPGDPDDETASAKMALVYGNEATDRFFGLLNGSVVTDVDYRHSQPTLEQPVLDAASDSLSYDDLNKRLSFNAGVMSLAMKEDLKDVTGVTPEFKSAVDGLYSKTRVFFDEFPELKSFYDTYDASNDPAEKKRSGLLESLLSKLKHRRKRQQVLEVVGSTARVKPGFAAAVIDDAKVMHASGDSARPALDDLVEIGTPGLTADFFFRDTATGDSDQPGSAAPDLAYSAGGNNRLPSNPTPGGAVSGIWKGYIEAPENGPYGIRIEADPGAAVSLELGGQVRPLAPVPDSNIWHNTDRVELRAGKIYPVKLTVENVRDNLTVRWETTERRWEVIPARYLYTPAQLEHPGLIYVRFLKIASLASALKLTAAETAFIASHADYRINAQGWLNTLPVTDDPDDVLSAHLFTVLDALLGFARIKADLSPDDERFMTVLRDPVAATKDDDSLLFTLTRWNPLSLTDLRKHFGGNVASLGHIDFFERVYNAFAWARKLGVPATTLIGVTTNEPGPVEVRDLQSALRARHDEGDWLDVLKPVNDELRELQRDALVTHILHGMSQHDHSIHIDTPEKLFEYFLMDVQMAPCTLTSRIRHALSSVQLFIERCLMSIDTDVAPSLIDAEQWEWMSRYRVWEANRKVFVFPENWLEPELRDDQSPIFKETMSELLQSDITEDRAATALLNYLSRLDEVAKLEPCGLYHVEGDPEEDEDDIDHVVARTAGANRKYFYRRRESGSWTPWEHIKLEIEDNPVIPVVWKGRLFLFWLRVLQRGPSEAAKPFSSADTGTAIASLTPEDIEVDKTRITVEAILCWSEYYNGKWQPTKTSDPSQPAPLGSFVAAGDYAFDRSKLGLGVWENAASALQIFAGGIGPGTSFLLYNSHSLPLSDAPRDVIVMLESMADRPLRFPDSSGDSLVLKYFKTASWPLTLDFERPVLENRIEDKVVRPQLGLEAAWQAPFFYEDGRHVYHITTTEKFVQIAEWNNYNIEVYPANSFQTTIPALVTEPHLERLPHQDLDMPIIRDPFAGTVDPLAIERFVVEDAYISQSIGTLETVRFGDNEIGPSGVVARRR